MSIIRVTVLGAAVGALTACAPGPVEVASWPEPRPIGRHLPTAPGPDTVTAPEVEPLTGSITLRQALAAALLRSPALSAYAYDVRAAEADVIQASVLPNPTIEFEVEEFAGTNDRAGFTSAEESIRLSQVIELGGKRSARHTLAAAKAAVSGWDYEIQRISVLCRTAADYIALISAQRQYEWSGQAMQLAQQVADAIEARVESGKSPPLERSKARVLMAQATLEHNRAERELATARIRLVSNWGADEPAFAMATGDLDAVTAPPELDDILGQIEANPELARWAAVLSVSQAEHHLAQTQRTSDLKVGAGLSYYNETDDVAFSAGVSLPLQIFDRNDGAIAAARMRLLGDRRRMELAQVAVRSELTRIHLDLESAFLELQALERDMLPAAQDAFDSAQHAFRSGKVGALDLLDAQRTLIGSHRQLLDAETTYHLTLIRAEQLIGAPLHGSTIDTALGENE
ncbi:MAG: TolC family protein [Planctomycetes bacterium]|nr:TolC family protein [Planctomycetota bacterium]NOG55756.1 TolC family protein [Planctomycetota bacterium]